MYFRWT